MLNVLVINCFVEFNALFAKLITSREAQNDAYLAPAAFFPQGTFVVTYLYTGLYEPFPSMTPRFFLDRSKFLLHCRKGTLYNARIRLSSHISNQLLRKQ